MPVGNDRIRTRDRQSMITVQLRPARPNCYVTRTCVAEGRLPFRDARLPARNGSLWRITLGIRPAPKPCLLRACKPVLAVLPLQDNPAHSGPTGGHMPDPFRPVKAELYIYSSLR